MATRGKSQAAHTFDEDSWKRVQAAVRAYERMPRGVAPPRRRWPLPGDTVEIIRFPAILFDKISYPIGGASDASEAGDLLWDDPLSDALYGNCPPAFPDRLRGEFSWVQATEMMPAQAESMGGTDEDEDFGEVGVMMPLDGGWCGFAGQCDAAHEYNRSNGNMHLERMTVEIVAGIVPVRVPCGELEDVQITVKGRTVTAKRFGRRAWWNGNMPREDCADRYMITMSPDNDTPSA